LISTKALDTPEGPSGVPLLKSTKALTPPVPIHARRRAARAAGVSESTYREGRIVLESAPPELKEKVRRGEISIHTAYKRVVPRPTGQCRLNGVLVPDPPDIAKARRSGKIAPDVVPEIEDPGDGDDVVTFADDGGDEPAAGTDAEWLATLPVWHQLGPGARVRFEVDALAYRACEEARGRFAHAVRSVLASASRRGSLPTFLHRTRSYLKINHPRHWTLCPAPEHGGCGGTGILDITGTCTRCFGGGYLI
jgi:hypothetical protein